AWSPDGDVLWAGTDDGRVHRTTDEGATWEDVTPEQLPEWAWITCIEPDPHAAGTAYLTATAYRLQDRTPYLLVTRDGGQTWAPAATGIEPDDYLRVVRADPARPGVLYAGSESRAYFSLDGAESWHPLRLNMPAVPIYDLAVVGDELVAASHGRGFWILDGLHVLGHLSEPEGAPSAALLVPDFAYRFPIASERERGATMGLQYLGTAAAFRPDPGKPDRTVLNGGENPPDGVTVRYFLPEPVEEGSLGLTVLDATGAQVIALAPSALGVSAGFHRAVWDLRATGPRPLPAADPDEDAKETRGPLVPPGRYTVRLEGPGVSLSGEVEVRADPRLDLSADAFSRQYQVGLRIREERDRVTDAIARLRRVREQVTRWNGGGGDGGDDQGIRDAAARILERLDALERQLTQPGIKDDADRLKFPAGLDQKLGALSDLLDSVDAPPTAATEPVLEELAQRARAAIGDVNSLIEGPVADLDQRIRRSNLPIVGG
ncbi:MAG: hypothetical protein J2P38_11130, partial [Candidatus Dormibacteraeota bacterium]|nr:hypothetical protein [Candidatus Dormibacteraeota bacterium]